MSGRTTVPEWLPSALLGCALVATGSLIWFLAEQNRALKATLNDVVTVRPATRRNLSVGDRLPNLSLVDITTSRERTLRDVSGLQLVAFLTTTCQFCEQTIPAWEAIAVEVPGDVTFLGISLHGKVQTSAYVREHSIDFPVMLLAESAQAPRVPVSTVPTTVLMDEDGMVLAVWLGALNAKEAEDIMAVIRARRR